METLLEVNGNARPYREGMSDLEGLLLFVMENEKPDHEVITDVRVDGASFSEDYDHQARGVDLKEVARWRSPHRGSMPLQGASWTSFQPMWRPLKADSETPLNS